MKGNQVNKKAKENIDKTASVFGQFINEVFGKSPIEETARMIREQRQMTIVDKFIEMATKDEWIKYVDENCDTCHGAGEIEDMHTELEPHLQFNENFLCDCISSDENIPKIVSYWKNKGKEADSE